MRRRRSSSPCPPASGSRGRCSPTPAPGSPDSCPWPRPTSRGWPWPRDEQGHLPQQLRPPRRDGAAAGPDRGGGGADGRRGQGSFEQDPRRLQRQLPPHHPPRHRWHPGRSRPQRHAGPAHADRDRAGPPDRDRRAVRTRRPPAGVRHRRDGRGAGRRDHRHAHRHHRPGPQLGPARAGHRSLAAAHHGPADPGGPGRPQSRLPHPRPMGPGTCTCAGRPAGTAASWNRSSTAKPATSATCPSRTWSGT